MSKYKENIRLDFNPEATGSVSINHYFGDKIKSAYMAMSKHEMLTVISCIVNGIDPPKLIRRE